MKSMDPEPNFSRTLLVLSCTAPAPEKRDKEKDAYCFAMWSL